MSEFVEGCTHRTPHRHGTRAAYSHCPCSCDRCRAAGTAQNKRARWMHHTGKPAKVPAPPVRAHMDQVLATMSLRELARRSEVSVRTISRIRSGVELMDRDVAARLLAIAPIATDIGVGRRVQGLVALGWPAATLAERLQIHESSLLRLMHNPARRGHIPDLPERIIALFDELQATPPPPDVVPPPMARRARRWAARQHWAPPAAWDNIDDPTERPKGVAWDERRAA